MDDQLFVKISDEIPETHYFVYKQKKYPINFDLFKLSSKYFYENKDSLEHEKNIQLINENLEEVFTLTDDIIHSFIKYSHREKIPINKENVIQLNYLAKIYDISSLLTVTNQYISDHHQELSIKFLSFFQNEPSFEASSYEDIISDHFIEYLKDDSLLNLKTPIIYRIISKYHSKNAKNDVKIQNKEIIDFLFKYLDKNGREASILFSLVDFNDSRVEHLNLLLNKYSKNFDFHFINYSFLSTCYQRQNELFKKEIENRISNENIVKEIQQIKKSYNKQIEQQNSRIDELENQIKNQKTTINDIEKANQKYMQLNGQQKNKIDELEKQIKNQRTTINDIEKANQKYSQLNGQQKNKIDELENQIKNQRSTISDIEKVNQKYSQLNEQQNNKIDQLENLIKKQGTIINEIEEANKKYSQLIDKQNSKIDELENKIKSQDKKMTSIAKAIEQPNKNSKKSKIDEMNSKFDIKTFTYTNNLEFEGIINHLTKQTGGNIHDNKTIEVTSNSIYSESDHPKNLLIFDDSQYLPKRGEKYFWVCFDFKNMEIEISNYTIKSFISIGIGFIKNWVIEISNDGNTWKTIDTRTDCSDLKESNIVKTFHVSKNFFARYCRFRHTGDFWGYSSKYVAGFKCIEFFGSLKSPK